MSTCKEMVNFFYSAILQLLDFYTPLTRKSTNNLDKPWVTTEFIKNYSEIFNVRITLQFYCTIILYHDIFILFYLSTVWHNLTFVYI